MAVDWQSNLANSLATRNNYADRIGQAFAGRPGVHNTRGAYSALHDLGYGILAAWQGNRARQAQDQIAKANQALSAQLAEASKGSPQDYRNTLRSMILNPALSDNARKYVTSELQSITNAINAQELEGIRSKNRIAELQAQFGGKQGLQTNQQEFTATENQKDREQQTALQTGQQTFTGEQNELDRKETRVNAARKFLYDRDLQREDNVFTGEQNELDRGVTVSEGALDRQEKQRSQASDQVFTAGENQLDRQQTGIENTLDRQARANLQTGQQEFTAGENELDRQEAQRSQASGQVFQSGENALNRQASSLDSALDRLQQTNLQEDRQEFEAGESALDRKEAQRSQASDQIFKAGENQMDRMLDRLEASADRSNDASLQAAKFLHEEEQNRLDREAGKKTGKSKAELEAEWKNQPYNKVGANVTSAVGASSIIDDLKLVEEILKQGNVRDAVASPFLTFNAETGLYVLSPKARDLIAMTDAAQAKLVEVIRQDQEARGVGQRGPFTEGDAERLGRSVGNIDPTVQGINQFQRTIGNIIQTFEQKNDNSLLRWKDGKLYAYNQIDPKYEVTGLNANEILQVLNIEAADSSYGGQFDDVATPWVMESINRALTNQARGRDPRIRLNTNTNNNQITTQSGNSYTISPSK